ncbi:MAG: O-acetylhomoserine aminocarboxypropyltransferase/cysteine synthase [Alphaproteobacteria bacterium]|nr:O-acetylhomoserine aminocarboxypropyltransferase/cysteine synthase [Alphaproteobacteria bacterium]MBV9695189.1 O-acetylhomoserine aminocarboxypropyltransferase/cysteine synthase [Alphaproteobacteria bacterium]
MEKSRTSCDWRPETIVLHGGFDGDPATKAVAVPIYQTVAYGFDNAEHAAALFNLETEGFRYSRIANPTTDVLEQRLAALEGGAAAVCVSSGQAALMYAALNVSRPGGNIVSVPQLYGTTYTLFAHMLPTFGVTVRFASDDSAASMAALVDENTCALYCESVGNPAGNICDLAALAEVSRAKALPLIVDNTVATPVLLRPIEHGAHIVVHSLTKYIGGHGTTLGGAIVDAGTFPWTAHRARFPMFNEPDRSYHGIVYAERFGRSAFAARCRNLYLRNTGAALSPMSAFLLMMGLETLPLRVERHVHNARLVAEFLRADPRVRWVNYAGFAEHPHHALAQRYLDGQACALLTFATCGGLEGSCAFYDALRITKRLVNLGDAKTLACHPASTTHRQLSEAELKAAGVTPDMIRLSVGIEHIDDIIADLDQALAAAAAVPGAKSAARSAA